MGVVEWTFLLLTPVTYFAVLVAERLWPARAFPPRQGWQWTGVAFLILSMAIGVTLPLFLPWDWIASVRWFDGSGLGVIGGAILGFVVLELGVYAWHRAAHTFGFMWRGFHQLHHSPQRVDIAGSLLFHPLESIAYNLIPISVTVIVLGLDPLAAAVSGYLFTFYALFQHMNVRTPQWLGYIIQRPESRSLHHARGVHFYNFSDLPLWDIVFGTFRNPESYAGPCGFDDGPDRRIGAMLFFQDVNAPVYGEGSLGAQPSGAR